MNTKPLPRVQRQTQIGQLVVDEGSAKAIDLAERFGVSVMTIHRDFDELERQGVLRKTRGNATAQPSGVFESSVAFRLKANIPEKQAIAAVAAGFVEPGMSVMLDDSTTALQMIPHLAKITPIKVATNFLEAIRQLALLHGIGLMVMGGDYDPQHDSFLGLMCMEAIESIRVDATFLSTSAVAGPHSYHQEQGVVAFKRAMLKIATEQYLLLDHTKLGKTALHRLVPLSHFTAVIVDEKAPAELVADLRQHVPRVEIAAM